MRFLNDLRVVFDLSLFFLFFISFFFLSNSIKIEFLLRIAFLMLALPRTSIINPSFFSFYFFFILFV